MNFIVSVDQHWGIGKQNDLLFSIREDMRFFKNTTMGGTVVMGDKTLLSLPGAKPLPGRENLVLSLDPAFQPKGLLCFPRLRPCSTGFGVPIPAGSSSSAGLPFTIC